MQRSDKRDVGDIEISATAWRAGGIALDNRPVPALR